MRALARKLFFATFAAMILAGSSSTAQAAGAGRAALPPEYLAKVQFLVAKPRDDMALGRLERSIYLRAGTYEFGMPSPTVDNDPFGCGGRDDLPEGWYSWRGQLDPKNGYYIESFVLEGPTRMGMTCPWQNLTRDGDYSWGSKLQYVGP